jgi:transposase
MNDDYLRRLEARINELEKENKRLKNENQELLKRIKALESKVNQYDNANTPSSRKSVFEQQSQASQEDTPKNASGRPEGHEGSGRKTPKKIHEKQTLEPVKNCPLCGQKLHFKGWRERTLTRLVSGWLENIQFNIPTGKCEHCNKNFEPSVPNALPNSRFDLTLAFWIACLRMLGVSIDKIRFLLKTDYGLHVSKATVVNTCNKLAEFLGKDYEQLRVELLKEKRAHADETSWPVKGVNWWLWEFIGRKIAFYAIRHSRGHDVPKEILKGYSGVLSVDFWNAYNVLSCEKQRCWAHLKRELDHVLKKSNSTEFAQFACEILTLYYWAKSQRNHGKNTRLQAEEQLRLLTSKEYRDADVLRLVKRFRRHEKELFTFCARRGVEKDNNRAERGIRPAVVIRKTSFGSQSERGANTTATLMSFFQTARLQDVNFINYMQNLTNNRL